MLIGEHQQLQGPPVGTLLLRRALNWPKLRLIFLLSIAFALGYVEHREELHVPLIQWIKLHTHPRYVEAFTSAGPLPTLSIDVKFKHVEKLRRKRQEALEIGLLFASDDDFVPAKLRHGDRTISAKLRLKGDIAADHLSGDKWSLRIKTKGDDHFLGMRRFSIQHPETRRYLYEWGFLESLRREGILAPRYRFINVIFNGEDRGIYALEEHFSKELLESQQRREGVIIKPDENEFWVNRAWTGGFDTSTVDAGLRRERFLNYHIDTFRSTHVASNPSLAKQRDEAIGLLRSFQEGKRNPSEVFDLQITSRYMALTELWMASHSMAWTNSRYYYNPITARLEPIGFDAMAFKFGHRTRLIWTQDNWNHRWRTGLRRDPVMAAAYVRSLQQVSEPSYLEELKQQLGEEMQGLLNSLSREFALRSRLRLPWPDLEERQAFIRGILSPNRMVLAFTVESKAADEAQHRTDLIEVRNVLDLPVEIVALQVGEGSLIPAQSVWAAQPDDPAVTASDQAVLLLVAENDAPPQYTHFVVTRSANSSANDDADAPMIYLHTRLIGHERVIRTPVLYQPQAVTTTRYDERITVDQALAQHEFLEQRDNPGDLWIKSGTWKVHEDLVIPQDIRLRASPDTVLKFGENAVMVVQGPVDLRGTPDQPVILEPLNATWPGMVVMKAKQRSTLEHVTVRGARGIARRGWIMTGGVTFYKSPVLIESCHFEDISAEDGLNIIRTEFDLRGSRFSRCASDAFDGDFATGIVQGCEFTDIRADGIDLSGSEVVVAKSAFDQIGDKAISVGERSTVQVRSISVLQSRFGVVSKDRSTVTVNDIDLRQVQYGLAAFVKKPEFGPAHLEAQEIRMTQVARPSLVQTGSTMTIDGQDQATEELDVESLYHTSAINHRKNGKV